jgi:septation ring formation regulator EzrA
VTLLNDGNQGLAARVTTLETNLAALVSNTDQRFTTVDTTLNEHTSAIASFLDRFDQLDSTLKSLRDEMGKQSEQLSNLRTVTFNSLETLVNLSRYAVFMSAPNASSTNSTMVQTIGPLQGDFKDRHSVSATAKSLSVADVTTCEYVENLMASILNSISRLSTQPSVQI